MRTLVTPAFGSLTLREIGVARCDRFIKQLAKLSYNRAKQARVVLVGPIIRIEHMMGEAIGEIVIQAPGPSGGRKSRVEMRVRAESCRQISSRNSGRSSGFTPVLGLSAASLDNSRTTQLTVQQTPLQRSTRMPSSSL